MNHEKLQKLILAALFAALTYVATNIIHIPTPATNGYVNLGECMVLLGAFLLGPLYGAAAGGIVGTVLGGALTQSVGASILGDAETAAVELATGASTVLTALSGIGCVVLFLLLTAIFTATYIGKEPRALLPKDQV